MIIFMFFFTLFYGIFHVIFSAIALVLKAIKRMMAFILHLDGHRNVEN